MSASTVAALPDGAPERPRNWKRLALRTVISLAWGAAAGLQIAFVVSNPSLVGLVAAVGLATLGLLIAIQILIGLPDRQDHLSGRMRRLLESTYFDEGGSLPNRNYLLAVLRSEMPQARATGRTFTILEITVEDLGGVLRRRGEDLTRRCAFILVSVVQRVTRQSDFLASLDRGSLCVVLHECTAQEAKDYIRRLPPSIPVGAGHRLLNLPVTLRVLEYDLESVDATDVLRELQSAPALTWEHPHSPGIAAA